MRMKNLVRQVIHKWNPYGLLPHAPDDEFDSEITKAIEALQQASTLEEFAGSIQKIFSESFGESFKYEECLAVATQIWNKAS